MIELIYQLIMMVPTGVEVIGDRKGDSHTNRKDFIVRVLLTLACAFVVAFIHGAIKQSFPVMWEYFPKCLAVTVGYFCGFFNYLVNIAQKRVTEDYKWWDHLNDKSWPDNWEPWRRIGWRWRVVVSLSIFFASLIYYFL